jgi:EAL domain-containing protein (putative c-di-GMP-specific phosphodiesterase class I)
MTTELNGAVRSQDGPGPAEASGQHDAIGEPPVCFIADRDEAHRHFISLVLQGHGIEAVPFANVGALSQGVARKHPDLIFLDVSSADAMETIQVLACQSYRGPVQPISAHNVTGFEAVKQMAQRHGIKVLPPLQKPMDRSVLKRVVEEQKLDLPVTLSEPVDLELALRQGWIEFWYQPKIDLRRKQLVGVELFARVRHPQRGVIAPGAFMMDADERSLATLTEMSIVDALKIGRKVSELGTRLKLAVNVSIGALAKVSLPAIMREHRGQTDDGLGLILDVTENEIASDYSLVREIHAELEPSGIGLAIDDFGRGYVPLMRLHELPPFAEFKLNRGFVADCGSDHGRAALCRAVINVAHNFGSSAIGVGVEKPEDAQALFRMGCDFGQGYLFAQPMTEERFYGLLRQRAEAHKRRLAALRQSAA